jgi:truncated hemoglobin YjbI
MCDAHRMRPTLFEFAGGAPAFLALAAAHHARCLQDPELNHPFSHPDQNPQHVERLAAYWAEVMGGPTTYSQTCGDHPAMLRMHAGNGDMTDLGQRFVRCFVRQLTTPGCRPIPNSAPRCARTSSGRWTRRSRIPSPRTCRASWPYHAGPGTACYSRDLGEIVEPRRTQYEHHRRQALRHVAHQRGLRRESDADLSRRSSRRPVTVRRRRRRGLSSRPARRGPRQEGQGFPRSSGQRP